MNFNKENKFKPEIVRENRNLKIINKLYKTVWPLEDVLSNEPKNFLREKSQEYALEGGVVSF